MRTLETHERMQALEKHMTHLLIGLDDSPEIEIVRDTWDEYLQAKGQYHQNLAMLAKAAKEQLGFMNTGDDE